MKRAQKLSGVTKHHTMPMEEAMLSYCRTSDLCNELGECLTSEGRTNTQVRCKHTRCTDLATIGSSEPPRHYVSRHLAAKSDLRNPPQFHARSGRMKTHKKPGTRDAAQARGLNQVRGDDPAAVTWPWLRPGQGWGEGHAPPLSSRPEVPKPILRIIDILISSLIRCKI